MIATKADLGEKRQSEVGVNKIGWVGTPQTRQARLRVMMSSTGFDFCLCYNRLDSV
jgi:hypothetical protein